MFHPSRFADVTTIPTRLGSPDPAVNNLFVSCNVSLQMETHSDDLLDVTLGMSHPCLKGDPSSIL
jgi:hypothetical protein